jgi:hypothetical protein
MAQDIPRPRSYPQQLGDMIDSVTSRVGITRLKVGGPLLSVLEAAAQSDIRQSHDIFNLLNATDLDNSEGLALDRIGNSERVPRFLLLKATGTVDFSDTSFTRVSSRVFHGTSAPIVGSTVLNVESALGWPATGSVYIGRTTPSIEGPLAYSSITPNGAYYTLNLATPTTRFHNKGEDVVLAQGGNRIIDAGYIVATAQGALSSAVQFSTVFEARIPDGEVEIKGVEVIATTPGIIGNAPAFSVKDFSGGSPFSGAAVINNRPFITGRDTETDNDYRTRIRQARNNKQRGTDLAVESAVVGAISRDDNKRISSANIVRKTGYSALYIDDGSGYEETSEGVGIEVITDSAIGGEQEFQVLNRPVSKAFLESRNQAPFDLVDSSSLSIAVGGVVTTHSFDSEDFKSISSASAYEVVSSINANSELMWSARTSGSGTRVVIISRTETNEDLEVRGVDAPGIDAGDVLLFPDSHHFTSLLYRNDRLLSKDGAAAIFDSRDFVEWNVFSGTQTIVLSIDGTPGITYSFTDQDFIDANTGFNSVGKNSLASWATVINKKIPGIKATVEVNHLVLTSSRGRDDLAAISCTGGTLVSNFVFEVGSSSGVSNDYSLDRGTGQIVTSTRLNQGDRLTMGSSWTRGFLETPSIAPITIPDIETWWLADGDPAFITHGVGSGTPLTATIEKIMEHGFRLMITATSTTDTFANVRHGDWAVLWDTDIDLPASLRRAWRVIETQLDGGNKVNKLILEKRAAKTPRLHHAMCALIPSGGLLSKVLVCGGYASESSISTRTRFGTTITEECEVFDPNTGTWVSTGPMATPRALHTASILPDGRVIAIGGYDRNGAVLSSTEIWDSTTGLWVAGPSLAIGRAWHTADVLVSGRVLVVGGIINAGTGTNSSVEYDPGSNTFISAVSMSVGRYGHTTVVMPSAGAGAEINNVFVIGGASAAHPTASLSSMERYDVVSPGWSAKTGMGAGSERCGHSSALLHTGASDKRILVLGDGQTGVGADNRPNYQVYTVSSDTWTANTLVESGWRWGDNARALVKTATNNSIIARGGRYLSGGLLYFRSKKFNPVTLTWSTLATSGFAAGWEMMVGDGVALTGGASPDRVFWYGGLNAGNTSEAGTRGHLVATHEIWNDDTSGWETLDESLALSSDSLNNRGLTIVRTTRDLQRVLIPAGANYTAPSFVDALNPLVGITSSVYRTSRIRVITNSFDLDGDITLVASTDTASLPISVGTSENLVGHFASVEAQNSSIGTPHEFQTRMLVAPTGAPHSVDAVSTLVFSRISGITHVPPLSTSTVLGLKRWRDGLNPNQGWRPGWPTYGDLGVSEHGNSSGAVSVVAAQDVVSDRFRVGLRGIPHQDLVTATPVVFAHPYAMGPRDAISVVVDEDISTKQFTIPMFRQLKPTTANYGSTVVLRDISGGDLPLAQTFGQTYDFDDFAVYMKARAKSHSSDSTRRLLWRFWRHGPEGTGVVVRYFYPDAPDADIGFGVKYDQNHATSTLDGNGTIRTTVDIKLASGAAKTASVLTPSCRIGLARVNPVGFGVPYQTWDTFVLSGYTVIESERLAAGAVTRLRLQVPNPGTVALGPQSTGLSTGQVLWFEAANPTATTLYSGSAAITLLGIFNTVDGWQDVTIPANTLHDGSSAQALQVNPGTLSFDSIGETIFDPATAVNDLVRLSSPLPASFIETTMRVVATGRQFLRCRSLDPTSALILSTPVWTTLLDTSAVSIFGGPTDTAGTIASTINGLASTGCPVTATVVGTGAGIITQATWDELGTDSGSAYPLTDGLNWVQRTIDPPLPSQETQFLFKDPIDSGLQVNSDWINEDVRISPVLTSDVVAWMKTPAMTGLWSVAEISASDNGQKVQIGSLVPGSAGAVEVQGGSADLSTAAVVGSSVLVNKPLSQPYLITTVRTGESDGFIGGRWVVIDNTEEMPKTAWWTTSTYINSVTINGLWTPGVTPYSISYSAPEMTCHFESVGGFVAIHIPNTPNSTLAPTDGQCRETYNIYISTPVQNRSSLDSVASVNTGVFKVIRRTFNNHGTTIWIENANSIAQAAVCDIKVLTPDSMIPGDSFVVSTEVFGAGNRGAWTVVSVGESGGQQFVNNGFTVDTTTQKPQVFSTPIQFGADASMVQLYAVPARLFKKIAVATPNTADSGFADIQFDTSLGNGVISSSAGSVITALDKFGFPSGINTGVDGYSYSSGLIGEANRIVYGDPNDESTYPGYAANGASILVQGPLVRRIEVALSLRVQSGLASEDLADRVRSAVAAVINQSGVGVSISLSDIIGAASSINGVIAVSVVEPLFTSVSDVIKVAAAEKPLVLDLKTDIRIAFVGE